LRRRVKHDAFDRLLLPTILDNEYPRLVHYRLLFEAYASPLTLGLAPAAERPVKLAFHDARFASADPPRLVRRPVEPSLLFESSL